MIGCQHKEVTGSVQKKNGYLYLALNIYIDGKRRPKYINTGLTVKGYHQRDANTRLQIALEMLNSGFDLDAVCGKVQGAAFKRKPKEVKENLEFVQFIQEDSFKQVHISLPKRGIMMSECVPQGFIQVSENQLISERPRGTRRGDTLQVAEYFAEWIITHKRHCKDNSYSSYKRHVEKRIVPYFSRFDVTLSELEPYDITAFYNYCDVVGKLDKKGGAMSASSLHRIHSTVHKALNDAVTQGTMKYNPAANAKVPKNNDYIATVYTEDEVNRYIQFAMEDSCALPLILAFCYGLRRSEALGLKVTALDMTKGQIEIRHTVTLHEGQLLKQDITKSKKSHRALPILPEVRILLINALERHKKMREVFGANWNPEGYLCVYDDGNLIHPNTLSKHYKKVAKTAKLPVNRLHDARHTNITICMKNGMGMRKTQAWAGHSTITVTERYAHWDNKDLEDVANSVAGSIRIFPVAVEDQQVGVSEVSPKCRQGVSKASPAFQAQLQSAPVIAQWG